MDIYKAILDLTEEKRRLDRAIAALEQGGPRGAGRPRRRSWNASARRAAAERLRQYWEQRRQRGKAYSVSPPSTDSV